MLRIRTDIITKKKIITVDRGVRYIGNWPDFSLSQFYGPYIIDKKIPGCGFTEYCLTCPDDIILCSPRRILLRNKQMQHPDDVHYVKNELEFDQVVDIDSNKKSKSESIKKESKIEIEDLLKTKTKMKEDLINYIHLRDYEKKPCKIIVTYDSFKHVVEFLKEEGCLGQFKVVVDEFQSIFVDSRFKASTEFEFFSLLQTLRNDICFVSATPMISKYLSQLDYFKSLPYYELDWAADDPGRVIKPELKIRKVKSIISEVKRIIDEYKSGKFAVLANPITGHPIKSKEAVFYLNSVGDIIKIIDKMGLKPDEVNILCSDNPHNRLKIRKKLDNKKTGLKYEIGIVPLRGEQHKMFTFCTRTVYLGADFYSTNARTFIFSDANIESLSVDISLDLPQILGRQRLIENPWKNHAEFYFKNLGVGKDVDPQEFSSYLEDKVDKTNGLLDCYMNETKEKTRESLLEKFEVDIYFSKYSKDYISLNYVDKEVQPVFNKLVHISEQRAFEIQQIDYRDRFTVFNVIKNEAGVRLDKIGQYVDYLRSANNGHIGERLRDLCENTEFTHEEKKLIAQQVSEKFDQYYNLVGPERCAQRGYNVTYIKEDVRRLSVSGDDIRARFMKVFKVGDRISNVKAKQVIKEIYESLGLKKGAMATDLGEYFNINQQLITDPELGKRVHGIVILGKK